MSRVGTLMFASVNGKNKSNCIHRTKWSNVPASSYKERAGYGHPACRFFSSKYSILDSLKCESIKCSAFKCVKFDILFQEIESISKDEPDSAEGEGAPAQVETAAADSTSTTPHTSKQITPVTSSEESDSEEELPPDITKPTGTLS